jgi:DNA-binding PadR family transcriptional regulator
LPNAGATYFVLAALLEGPLHGYAIMKRAEEMSGGRVRLATGTLYAALDRLTEQGSRTLALVTRCTSSPRMNP